MLYLLVTYFMNTSILVSDRDAQTLRQLLQLPPSARGVDTENFQRLSQELARARVVPAAELPPDVVALDSTVLCRNLATGESQEFTLVLPGEADPSEGRLSILAPIGTALLGFREGDEIEWPIPSGTVRMRLDKVRQPQYH